MWIREADTLLSNDDIGKDLQSVRFLLKIHQVCICKRCPTAVMTVTTVRIQCHTLYFNPYATKYHMFVVNFTTPYSLHIVM